MAMKCKAVIKEIEELERGASLSAESNAHMLSCASCSAFNKERTALRGLIANLERVSAPPDFDWKLRARLIEARSESEPSSFWHSVFTTKAQTLALAASFVFMVVAVVVYQQIKVLPSHRTQSAAIAAADRQADVNKQNEAATPSVVKPQIPASAGSPEETAKLTTNETPRTRPARSVKANGTRAEIASATTPQRIFSSDFGSRPAEEFMTAGAQDSFTDAGPVLSVPMRSPKSFNLLFEESDGTKRTLAPVRFGGQELIERKDAARLVPASEKGVW